MWFFNKSVQDPDEIEGCRLSRSIRRELTVRIKEMERVAKIDKPEIGGKEDRVERTDDEAIGMVEDIETAKTLRKKVAGIRNEVGKKGMGYLYALSDYRMACDSEERRKRGTGNVGRIEDYFIGNVNRYWNLIEQGVKPEEVVKTMTKEIMG